MAVEMKAGNDELAAIVAKCDHAPTRAAVEAERAFSSAVGGGCKEPVGAYATCNGETITLLGMLLSASGTIVRGSASGNAAGTAELGKKLAAELLEKADAER